MSGYSNVGNRGVYEAGDQRNMKNSEIEKADRYHEGNVNSHLANDSKDQRSIANRLAAAEQEKEHGDDSETAMSKKDPTLPATMHGNEPSKGAKIDAELAADDQKYLKHKGKK